MARAVKKSATRKTSARGSSGKKSAPPQRKRGGLTQKPAFAAEPQRAVARKRGRPFGSGRKASTVSQADSIVTAQLAAINNKLQSIVGLRNDIQDLRDSIEVLSGAVDAMLKASHESIETAREQEEPQAALASIEIVEVEVPELSDAE